MYKISFIKKNVHISFTGQKPETTQMSSVRENIYEYVYVRIYPPYRYLNNMYMFTYMFEYIYTYSCSYLFYMGIYNYHFLLRQKYVIFYNFQLKYIYI